MAWRMLTIRPIGELPGDALQTAYAYAPYLRRLSERSDAGELAAAPLAPLVADGDIDGAMKALRVEKQVLHLRLAGDDLSGARAMTEITAALTDFADQAVEAALMCALARQGVSNSKGIFFVALGKMGAHELNYSSDIDLCCFYDPDGFDGGTRSPGETANRVVRDVIKILNDQTADGYVFRTDLRLRPDPGSTPLAVSTGMADIYYESVGQNWERMVWIKGRVCAGDRASGANFLNGMVPFVWRRNLDYWALNDIQAIKRMINTKVGAEGLVMQGPDIKLGPGGIREIEFFVQTQQLILAGRDERLRNQTTLGALSALVEAGVVEEPLATSLQAAYIALRNLEHRLQMRHDAQTHTVPSDDSERREVAAMCGYDNLERFDEDLLDTRRQVQSAYDSLFSEADREAAEQRLGNLVFTGVDDDPGTVRTLAAQGFSDPSRAIDTIRNWHRGAVPATRTARGRELLTAVLPQMLEAMGRTGEADTAFHWFARFFEGLSSGVQTLSMLLAEPGLLNDLVATLALAPRLAQILARRPDLLEALVSGSEPDVPKISDETPFDTALDDWRRYHREKSFLIGHRLLHGQIAAQDAGQHWSALADETITKMARVACRETERRYGPQPGAFAVLAMGKLGGREMTAGSDLDILLIYETDDLGAQSWFTRLTQRLITALSAPTAEGELYEVDMRLRPSGRAGPVAVSLEAFERYQREDAWTWEHMALTRLRPICGDEALGVRALEIAQFAIVARAEGDAGGISKDISDMRERLYAERPGGGIWDVKLERGGLVDIEFVVQREALLAAEPRLIAPNTRAALDAAEAAERLEADTADVLRQGLAFQQALQQVQRLAVGLSFDDETAPGGLKRRLCRAVGAESFSALKEELTSIKTSVYGIAKKKLQLAATEKAG